MKEPDVGDLAINLIGLLGVLALSIPAFYVNRYGLILFKLSKLDPQSPALKLAKASLEADLKTLRDSWTWTNSVLLLGGTGLAGVSYGLGVVKAIVHPS